LPQEWLEMIKIFGVPSAVLCFVLYALHRQWWVPGWLYKDLRQRTDRLEASHDRLLSITEKGADVTEIIVKKAINGG
jgi:hypothetical protein